MDVIPLELQSHFLRLYQIAITDDNFDALELQMLYKFAKERGLSKEQMNQIITNPPESVGIPNTIEKRIEYLYDFAVMIWADSVITEDELITLKKYAKKFEFLDENIDELCDYLLEAAKQEKSKESIILELN